MTDIEFLLVLSAVIYQKVTELEITKTEVGNERQYL